MADMSAPEIVLATDDGALPATDTSRRKRLFRILAILVAVAALLAGVWHFLTQAGRVETDNAYVGADVAQVTALVSAPVVQVLAGGMQNVKKGAVLVILDPSDARVDLATAEANLRQAEQRYGASLANVASARARQTARGTEIAQARARLAEANAAFERARVELARRESLAGSGAVSGDELSAARAAYASARAGRDLAASGIATAQAISAAASSDVAAQEALVRDTTLVSAPEVAAARARVDGARLALDRTIIRAPVDGIVTNRNVQVGQRIAAGVTIMTLVPIQTAYVDANFKESQLRRVRTGMPVELVSDFYDSDVVYRGRVTGFAGGTGAAFALIPAQNATGNWVKVVQRLSVRIVLDPQQLREHPLRVGLSMTATVDTRGR